jgi:CubicO group peptidase (beta-lactamase class C family)
MTRRQSLQLLSASGLGVALPALAEPSSTETFVRMIEEHRAKHRMPAMAAAVVRGKNVLAMGGSGFRKNGGKESIGSEDVWHMGSLTKSMTGVLLAKAVEAGKFAWEDPLAKHLPNCHESLAKVTLLEIAEHRAGFAHSGPPKLWEQLRQRPGTPQELRAWWVPQAIGEKPATPPGSEVYSNFGYVLLGYLLEKDGVAWETQLLEDLAKPWGLQKVGFGPTDAIWAHDKDGRPVARGPLADNPAALGPAGTVHMSLADLAKYTYLHLLAPTVKNGLKAESWERLHTSRHQPKTPQVGAPGVGWFATERPWAKGPCFTHSGSNTLNYAVVWVAPKADLGLCVVCNQGGEKASKACDELFGKMIAWQEKV